MLLKFAVLKSNTLCPPSSLSFNCHGQIPAQLSNHSLRDCAFELHIFLNFIPLAIPTHYILELFCVAWTAPQIQNYDVCCWFKAHLTGVWTIFFQSEIFNVSYITMSNSTSGFSKKIKSNLKLCLSTAGFF